MAYKKKETALKHITQKKFYKENFDNFRDDKEVVLAAVSNCGGSLEYASDRLKDDKEVVLRAIDKSDGYVLEYASDRLRDDPEVVLEAVKQYKRSYQVASDRIKELCKDKDPVQVLESLVLKEQLGKELTNKEPVAKRKMKI